MVEVRKVNGSILVDLIFFIANSVAARIISFGGNVVRPWRSTVTLNCESVGSPRREWLKGEQILKVSIVLLSRFLSNGLQLIFFIN